MKKNKDQLDLFAYSKQVGPPSPTLQILWKQYRANPEPSPEEQEKLGQDVIARRINAEERLVIRNTRLAFYMATKYGWYGDKIGLEDLVQTALSTMVEFAPSFDYRKGCFANYVCVRIDRELRQLIASSARALSSTEHHVLQSRRVGAARKRLTHENGGTNVSKENIAAASGATLEKVAAVLEERLDVSLADTLCGHIAGTQMRCRYADESVPDPCNTAFSAVELEVVCGSILHLVYLTGRGDPGLRLRNRFIFASVLGINSRMGVVETTELCTKFGITRQMVSKIMGQAWRVVEAETIWNEGSLKKLLLQVEYLAGMTGRCSVEYFGVFDTWAACQRLFSFG